MATLKSTALAALLKAPGKYGDGDGLWLHVRQPGKGSWYFHYGSRARQRQMSLGNAGLIPLAEARDLAMQARKLLAHGIDPLNHRVEAKAAEEVARARNIDFAGAAEAYIKANEPGWRNAHHRYQWRATLDYACETIGSLPVSAINTDHVLQVLEPIWTTKSETASRLRGRIEMVLAYATARGWRDRNVINPALWRGHLQLMLPARRKVRAVEHLAALPWQEAPAFMRALRVRSGFGVNALEFAILTGVRSGEVRGARWDEIRLDDAVWTIPAARMKGGKPHRVPLSKPALAILREMAKLQDGSGLVFLGLKRGVLMSDMTLTAVLRRMGQSDITVHGFRSTFRDWAAEATSHPNHVVEQALAHAIPSAVEAAYRRGDLFEKRKALMDEWATFLGRPPAEIIALPGAGRRKALGRRGAGAGEEIAPPIRPGAG
jgi:integrase